MEVDGHTVVSKPVIKYPRVIIDAKLRFREHPPACQKVANVTAALT